jgi:tripartite-type tricarboxylate transporter receptor subunit TctC
MKEQYIVFKRLLIILLATVSLSVFADPYKEIPKTVQFIMPYGPGSVVDLQFRDFETFLLTKGIRLIGIYKPGANSVIAANDLLSSPKDGSVIMMNATSNSWLAEQRIGKPVIEPITTTGGILNVVTTQPGSKYDSYDKFVKALRDKDPGLQISWHAVSHLLYMNQITDKLGVDMPTLVPYKTSTEPARDAAGGHLSVAFIPYTTARPFLESGKLKIIFGFSPGNSNILPKGEVDLKKKLPGWKQGELFFVGLPPGTDQRIVDAWGLIYKEYFGLKETEEYFHKNFMSLYVGGPKFVAEVIALQAASFKKYNVEVK